MERENFLTQSKTVVQNEILPSGNVTSRETVDDPKCDHFIYLYFKTLNLILYVTTGTSPSLW